jgi:hypothetical protein
MGVLLGVLIVYMAWRRGVVLGKSFLEMMGGGRGYGIKGLMIGDDI